MNHTQSWLARVRPRHNPAENALIANMREDPHIPWLNSLAAMRHYARQRWPHDPGVQSLITGVWQRYRRWHDTHASGPEDKPWGMYEFAIPEPDETLVRIGRPSRPRNRADEVIE
jgi:hypothetical protein